MWRTVFSRRFDRRVVTTLTKGASVSGRGNQREREKEREREREREREPVWPSG